MEGSDLICWLRRVDYRIRGGVTQNHVNTFRGAAKWVAAIRFVIAYKTVVGFESTENVNRIYEELESMIRWFRIESKPYQMIRFWFQFLWFRTRRATPPPSHEPTNWPPRGGRQPLGRRRWWCKSCVRHGRVAMGHNLLECYIDRAFNSIFGKKDLDFFMCVVSSFIGLRIIIGSTRSNRREYEPRQDTGIAISSCCIVPSQPRNSVALLLAKA